MVEIAQKPAPVLTQLLGVNTSGNLAIVTPIPIDEVAEPLLEMIDRAVALFKAGMVQRAGAMIADVERRLGVTDADRTKAAQAGEAWEQDLERALAGMSAEEAVEVEKLVLPEDLERLTAAEVKTLTPKLDALRRTKNVGTRETLYRDIQAILRKPGQRVENRWRTGAINETVALAKARGEDVELPKRGGARIMSRQGIQQAFEEGHMTPTLGPMTADHLHDTAKTYRDAYEIAAGLAGRSGDGSGGYGAKGPQIKLVEAGEILAIMRLDLTQRQVDVLDRVCGQDMRLREAATVLRRGFPSTKNSLIMGLKAATLNIRAAKAVRDQGEPTTKARLESARAQVDAAMRAAG